MFSALFVFVGFGCGWIDMCLEWLLVWELLAVASCCVLGDCILCLRWVLLNSVAMFIKALISLFDGVIASGL